MALDQFFQDGVFPNLALILYQGPQVRMFLDMIENSHMSMLFVHCIRHYISSLFYVPRGKTTLDGVQDDIGLLRVEEITVLICN